MGGDDLEAHRRLLVEQVAEHRRQQPLAEVVAGRHPQRGGGAAGQLGELAEGGLGPAPQLAHDGQRRLAGGGEAHAAAGALEELDAEVGLEPPDLLAHRRGGDVRWRAAAPTEPVRATASSVSSAGKRAASIMKRSLPFGRTFHWTTRWPWGRIRRRARCRRSRMARTLLDKVWEAHTVRTLPSGQTQLLIGLHLIHEVTTPQAFQMLKELEAQGAHARAHLRHARPHHPDDRTRRAPTPIPWRRRWRSTCIRNMKDFGLPLFDMATGKQGIVHVIGPELGLTQPGMTIACGDSHTSTHGAVGAIAFGIGTTQVRDVLATQCLAMAKPKLRQVRVEGALAKGVYAKDVILAIINQLGVKGGVGYAYEYAGSVIERMTMEERLTVCNMSIEGGARCGYVNPDATTIDYLRGRPYAPQGAAFDRAVDLVEARGHRAGRRVRRRRAHRRRRHRAGGDVGHQPGHVGGREPAHPAPDAQPEAERPTFREALAHMGFEAGQPIKGAKIDVAFVGSCTNGRLSDLRIAAEVAKKGKVAKHVRALIVPGSQQVAKAAEAEGLHEIFQAAGFEWRKAGCSMCLGMNPDKLEGREMSASVQQPQLHRPPGQPDRAARC